MHYLGDHRNEPPQIPKGRVKKKLALNTHIRDEDNVYTSKKIINRGRSTNYKKITHILQN